MKMPPTDLTINPDILKKLDAVGVIQRLIQKQNMQMRFVTLTKGWYKKDSGVLIGYYGENKNLAAMIPTAPDKYKVITKNFPDGIPIDEESARNIDKDAFVCYAGFRAEVESNGLSHVYVSAKLEGRLHDNYTCQPFCWNCSASHADNH